MSPSANGTSRSYSCARLSPVVRTRVTESRWRDWRVFPKKFSSVRKTSSHIWRNRTGRPTRKNREKTGEVRRWSACPRNRSWICSDEMPVKTENDLDEALRDLWLKAIAAIERRNFGYAISLLRGVLKQEPEFLTGRQLLRRAEVAKDKTQKRAFFHISLSAIWIMRAQRELK